MTFLLRCVPCQERFYLGIGIASGAEDSSCFLWVELSLAYMYDVSASSIKIGILGLPLELTAVCANSVTQQFAGDHRFLPVSDRSKHREEC